VACLVGAAEALVSPSQPAACLDLRGTPCPLNYIRCRLALETIAPGAWLQVDLDVGEPEQLVSSGLTSSGHGVEIQPHPSADTAVRLTIRRAVGPDDG
jgi:TusA-related sulfurtransferase